MIGVGFGWWGVVTAAAKLIIKLVCFGKKTLYRKEPLASLQEVVIFS